MKVLNRYLYSRLKRLCGTVKINHEGESMHARPNINYEPGEPRLNILHAGEYYQVCCPYCTDTRFRLWVSHMYGQKMRDVGRLNFLAVCYNETSCMTNPANAADFWNMIAGQDDDPSCFPVKKGVEVSEAAREVSWPGACTRVDKLRQGHKLLNYLEERGFDPEVIGQFWEARYCHESHYFLARDRLIIPVFERGKLKGWQARYIGELDWHDKEKAPFPKYFTLPGMPRRKLLYNWDRCKEYETAVIVEGPTDVWRFGAMATCTFGASMSPIQRRKFLTAFKKRTAVLLYDPEAMGEKPVRDLIQHMQRRMPGRFATVTLPEGTDPGSMDRDFLRNYVKDEARRLWNIKIHWRKVS